MRFWIHLIFLILWTVSAEASDRALTLDEAVSQVLARNPDIQASGYRTQAARTRVSQAKALDDPMVGVTFDDVPIDTANVRRSEEIDYRIDQKIPFPGKRLTRKKEALYDAQAIGEFSRGEIRDVLLDLKRTYYDIYRLDRTLEINRENQKLLGLFLESAEASYATNKVDSSAPLKAQVELSKLKNESLLLQQERVTHTAHLKAVLNYPFHEDIRLAAKQTWPKLKFTLSELQEMARASRPELTSLREMEKRDRSRLTRARQSLLPDFSLGFQYGQRPGAKDTWSGTAAVNLPLFFLGKNRSQIREARANLKATQAEHESMEIHTSHDIEQAYSSVQASQKILSQYQREILPEARTTLNAVRESYAANHSDFLTLIDAARIYRELQADYYAQQARLGMAFAELERLVGKDLKAKE